MGSRKPSAKELFFKTKLCTFWQAGRCNRGKSCSFAHGNSKKAALPDFYRTRLCPDLLATGVCKGGEDCAYAHSKLELRANVTKPNGDPLDDQEAAAYNAFADSAHSPDQARDMPNNRLSELQWGSMPYSGGDTLEGLLPIDSLDGPHRIEALGGGSRREHEQGQVRQQMRHQDTPQSRQLDAYQAWDEPGHNVPAHAVFPPTDASQRGPWHGGAVASGGMGRAPAEPVATAHLEQGMQSMEQYLQTLVSGREGGIGPAQPQQGMPQQPQQGMPQSRAVTGGPVPRNQGAAAPIGHFNAADAHKMDATRAHYGGFIAQGNPYQHENPLPQHGAYAETRHGQLLDPVHNMQPPIAPLPQGANGANTWGQNMFSQTAPVGAAAGWLQGGVPQIQQPWEAPQNDMVLPGQQLLQQLQAGPPMQGMQQQQQAGPWTHTNNGMFHGQDFQPDPRTWLNMHNAGIPPGVPIQQGSQQGVPQVAANSIEPSRGWLPPAQDASGRGMGGTFFEAPGNETSTGAFQMSTAPTLPRVYRSEEDDPELDFKLPF